MTDYANELKKYEDATPEEKAELSKLAGLQKDIAIGDSAEDFIRHPFFKAFEAYLNEKIGDSKNEILKVESLADLKSYQAKIEAIQDIKRWLNTKVMAKRVGLQAIELYEKETEDMNQKIQEAVDKSNLA